MNLAAGDGTAVGACLLLWGSRSFEGLGRLVDAGVSPSPCVCAAVRGAVVGRFAVDKNNVQNSDT